MTTETLPTPQERLTHLDTSLKEKYDAIAIAVTSGGDIGLLSMEYTSMLATRKVVLRESNHDAIQAEYSNICEAISTIVSASPLAVLQDEAVTSIFWELNAGSGENGPMMGLAVNKVPNRSAPRKAKEASSSDNTDNSNGAARGKAPDFQVDGGEVMTARQFVEQFAPTDVREEGQFKSGKFPTRPDFLDKTQEALEAQGHVITRREK